MCLLFTECVKEGASLYWVPSRWQSVCTSRGAFSRLWYEPRAWPWGAVGCSCHRSWDGWGQMVAVLPVGNTHGVAAFAHENPPSTFWALDALIQIEGLGVLVCPTVALPLNDHPSIWLSWLVSLLCPHYFCLELSVSPSLFGQGHMSSKHPLSFPRGRGQLE